MSKKAKKNTIHDTGIINPEQLQWRIYQNLKIFCEDYVNYKILSKLINKEDFLRNLEYDNIVQMIVQKSDKTTLSILIVDDIKVLINFIPKQEHKSIIIIYNKPLEKALDKIILKFLKYSIVTYNYNKFKFIVPKQPGACSYKILTDKETAIVCSDFKCHKNMFPNIKFKDPMAIWHGISRGDLVEITSFSESVGKNIIYRYCKKI